LPVAALIARAKLCQSAAALTTRDSPDLSCPSAVTSLSVESKIAPILDRCNRRCCPVVWCCARRATTTLCQLRPTSSRLAPVSVLGAAPLRPRQRAAQLRPRPLYEAPSLHCCDIVALIAPQEVAAALAFCELSSGTWLTFRPGRPAVLLPRLEVGARLPARPLRARPRASCLRWRAAGVKLQELASGEWFASAL